MHFGLLEITFGFKIYDFVVLVPFWPIFGSLLAAFAGQFDLTMVQDILMFDSVRVENGLYYKNIHFGNL